VRRIPILFSAPMVVALLEGRKTETRRLAGSRLSKVAPGDLLWVREATAEGPDGRRVHLAGAAPAPEGRRIPAMFMRACDCRILLEVVSVRACPLRSMSYADAVAEGVAWLAPGTATAFLPDPAGGVRWFSGPLEAFADLWDRLHARPGTRWGDDPEVDVIRFRRVQ
jgi:hypothetical protein